MRQKNVMWTVVLVTAVVIAFLAVFAIVRRGGHADARGQQGQHEHDSIKHHDNQSEMVEQDLHHKSDSSDHPGDSSDKELSGVLQDGQRIIKIKARQFEFEPNRIVVNKGETVRLEVTSEDVTHGIDIEGYDINRELEPDKTETMTFIADKAGQFHFHCSVYCGKGHSDMHGELIVVELSNHNSVN